jgi:bifunctional non-homologous end joining protein LigD
MQLPKHPMAPISSDTIPTGSDWGYQLKWDGVRILAKLEDGGIELYSRKMLMKNAIFPEVVEFLRSVKETCILDGEVIMMDSAKGRPSFQKVLQRERSKRAVRSESLRTLSISYVLFDILHLGDRDLRDVPYQERHRLLSSLFPEKKPQLFVSDLFPDGQALWNWVTQHEWEGIVSKRLSSTYKQDKKHQDWFKKKISLELIVRIVGFVIRDGQVASMIMSDGQSYFGRVSLGLDVKLKAQLLSYGLSHTAPKLPFLSLPADLKGEKLLWINKPFSCEVTGLEITDGGLLRHPKIRKLDVKGLL